MADDIVFLMVVTRDEKLQEVKLEKYAQKKKQKFA